MIYNCEILAYQLFIISYKVVQLLFSLQGSKLEENDPMRSQLLQVRHCYFSSFISNIKAALPIYSSFLSNTNL
jgi:hypothetical protein